MKLQELAEKISLVILNEDCGRDISGVYCCDLLSVVMGKAPADCAWVTVMANVNAVAVASLAEIGVIVFADGVKPDDLVVQKAKENNISIALSKDNIFDTALKIYEALK
jgi:hypothetical protein